MAAILEAARVAPTAVNKQPFRILVLDTPEQMAKLAECTKYTFGAPLALLVLAKKEEAWVSPFTGRNIAETDTSIVTDHMMLQATDLGLGTCWVGYFDPVPICAAFGVPEDLTLMHILPIGYPAEDSEPSQMHLASKKTSEFVTFL